MDNVDPIPEKFVLELWSVRTRRVLGIELISDTIGELDTNVATYDDNLIPLYVLTQAYWTVVLDLGDWGLWGRLLRRPVSYHMEYHGELGAETCQLPHRHAELVKVDTLMENHESWCVWTFSWSTMRSR